MGASGRLLSPQFSPRPPPRPAFFYEEPPLHISCCREAMVMAMKAMKAMKVMKAVTKDTNNVKPKANASW